MKNYSKQTMTNLQHFRRSFRALAVASIAALSGFAVACSHDSGAPAEESLAPNGTATGTQGDSTRNVPVGNAVAGIQIISRQITLLTGGTFAVGVVPVDQNGMPSLASMAGRPILTVGNSAVATVNNTNNTLLGVARGTTKLYATLGALKDSVVVTVLPQRDTTNTGGGNPPTPTTPTTPIPVFTLTVYAFGRDLPVSARDTANVVQLAGATISVYRLTQNPAVPADTFGIRTLVKTVIADASGKAIVPDLASGFYSISATATYQGAAMEGRLDFGPPRQRDFATSIYLNRK